MALMMPLNMKMTAFPGFLAATAFVILAEQANAQLSPVPRRLLRGLEATDTTPIYEQEADFDFGMDFSLAGLSTPMSMFMSNDSDFVNVDAASKHRRYNFIQSRAGKSSKVGKSPKATMGGFYHGVASGSPLPTAMIFWTRYTPLDVSAAVEIEYRIVEVPEDDGMHSMDDEYFANLLNPRSNNDVRYGITTARPDNDWVVKLDITGLKPATTYVYAFTDGYITTAVGKTKTPPIDGEPLDSLTFAVFSCANYNDGYFHAYDIASTIQGLDFWFHAGDYIYEYADADCEGDRCWEPKKEAVELDDYRQRYASYHLDEGLQNLRRSAALISTWDDHETANNSAGAGAESHQPEAEGLWEDRVKAAAQAYLEWMPFRAPMEQLEDGLLSQTFQFGNLMSFVTVDTRLPARSLEPALFQSEGGAIGQFLPAFPNVNTTAYAEEPLFTAFKNIADSLKERQFNSNYVMIGQDKIEYIAKSFQKSSDDGKPWQIFGDQTMMAKSMLPCISDYYQYFPPQAQGLVKAVIQGIIEKSFIFRAACAMLVTDTSFPSGDDWNSYAYERKKILEVLSNNASNPLVLFGDSHDSWAMQMDADGGLMGEPIAVNIGTPAVISPGLGTSTEPVLSILQSALNGFGFGYEMQDLQDIFSTQFEATNDNLVFANVYNKGFFSVTLTTDDAVVEFFGLEKATLALDFESARAANSNGITANYFCMTNLLSTAGQPGSLVEQADCGTTAFMNKRPGYWNATFNPKFKSKGSKKEYVMPV